jgi:hypothetical protein
MAPFQPHQSKSAVGVGSLDLCNGVSKGTDPTGVKGLEDTLRRKADSCSTMIEMRVAVKRRELYTIRREMFGAIDCLVMLGV